MFLQRARERDYRRKMVLSNVEAVPASSEPTAADDSMRSSSGGRGGFGALELLLTRASQMYYLGVYCSAFYPG